MPILVGQPVTPAPPPPRTERIEVTWTAPDGSVWPLTIPQGVIRAQATSSLGAVGPVEITADPNPRGGVDIRHVQDLERYLILPVLVRGDTHQQMIDRWRAIGDAFTQTLSLGPGTLRVTRPDGTWREIDAVYHSGWEGLAEQGWDWDVASTLTLLAPRPWWRGPAQPPVRREYIAGETPFLAPFMSISSSRVLGDTVVNNPGQVTAWPEWTITGPLDSLTATHLDTGEEWQLDPNWDGGGSLGAGETVTLSTSPIRIRGPHGEIWTGAVTGTLWGLRRGTNRVTFSAAGAGPGAAVEMRFHPLYRMG